MHAKKGRRRHRRLARPRPRHGQAGARYGRKLGRALHRPTIFPIPRFAMRLRFGEVANVLTTGQRVLPRKPLAPVTSDVTP